MRDDAASSRHAWYPAPLLPPPLLSQLLIYSQCVFRLFIHYLIDNRLIQYLIISLSTYLSSGCQVPSGYPFSMSPNSPCNVPEEEINLLSYKVKGKPCVLVLGCWLFFFISEARDLGKIGKNPDNRGKRESWQSCEPQLVSVVLTPSAPRRWQGINGRSNSSLGCSGKKNQRHCLGFTAV